MVWFFLLGSAILNLILVCINYDWWNQWKDEERRANRNLKCFLDKNDELLNLKDELAKIKADLSNVLGVKES